MIRNSKRFRAALAGGALAIGLCATLSSLAQTAPSPAKQAIENRRAAFTLIGNSFRWFGAVAKGAAPYDAAEAAKRAARIAFLVDMLDDAFPEESDAGEPVSKAKSEIWKNHADFGKKLAKFKTDAREFANAVAKEKGATDALEATIASLGQDCKECHDSYKVK